MSMHLYEYTSPRPRDQLTPAAQDILDKRGWIPLAKDPSYKYSAFPVPKTALQHYINRRNDWDVVENGDGSQIFQNVTEYDSFPYKRWFKGQYDKPYPLIHPRIAGWYPRQDALEEPAINRYNIYDQYPDHVFEASCNLRLPSRNNIWGSVGPRYASTGCDASNYDAPWRDAETPLAEYTVPP